MFSHQMHFPCSINVQKVDKCTEEVIIVKPVATYNNTAADGFEIIETKMWKISMKEKKKLNKEENNVKTWELSHYE